MDYFPAEACATRPPGGHVLWVEMPSSFDALRLYREALAQNIAIAPGVVFSASGNCYRNCFRLNTAIIWDERVEQAIQSLGYLANKQLAEQFLKDRLA